MTHTPLIAASATARRRPAAASIALSDLLLGPPQAGLLLGASEAAIYAGFDDGVPGVVALLPPTSVRLPLGMVIGGSLPVMASDAAVLVGEGALCIGDDAWVASRWFDPRPQGLATMNRDRLAAASDVLWKLSSTEVGIDTDRARAAVAALVAGHARAACALLGEGPGLTPAGDDVVAGALAACALLGRAIPPEAVSEVLAGARAATTSLSSALLSCAAAGQVVPQAARFLAALGGDGEVTVALTALRSVGATSGTALAVGIAAALTESARELGAGDPV